MSEIDKQVPFLCEEHVVRAHECGPDRCLKLPSLLDYLQDIAANHATLLGIGMEAMISSGTLWVLSRMKIRILRYPESNEKLLIKTYPSGIGRLFAEREYLITDERGKELVCGTSCWLILDAATLRPVRTGSLIHDLPENDDLPKYFPDLGKIAQQEISGPRESFPVQHADIDMNRHLNNAVYTRFLVNVLSEKLGTFAEIRELQINFTHAGVLGDRICCGAVCNPDGTFYADGKSEDGTKTYFEVVGRI